MPEPRVTAYWYAATHGLPCDLDSLAGLGLQAARRARWLGLEPLYVAEGPFWVHTWPQHLWDEVTDAFRDYPEVIPPWCPLPQGDQALRDIGY